MQVNLTEILIAIIGIIFTGVLIPLVRVAFKWLREKTTNEGLLTAITEAEKVADYVVAGIKASVVDGLKEKNGDGKLTADEARQVMDTAIYLFGRDLSQRSLDVIEANTESTAKFIANLIESRLAVSKK
jgi:hypothetical protein